MSTKWDSWSTKEDTITPKHPSDTDQEFHLFVYIFEIALRNHITDQSASSNPNKLYCITNNYAKKRANR